jgi:hypothetical protein
MATSNILVAEADGWVLAATDPGFLRISTQTGHKWSYAIASSLPTLSVLGTHMPLDTPLIINEPFTGNVYVRVQSPAPGFVNGQIRFDVTVLAVTSGGGGGGGDASAANQTTQITAANLTNTNLGGVTETAPATDTASSGLNGRLQRIAQRLTTVNTTLGSPFQAGGSIGNTSFAATQSGAWNIGNITGTVTLPTGAATAAKQPALGTAGVASTDVITVQGIASGTAQPVSQATASSLNAQIVGAVAHGSTDSGNPIKNGGYAMSAAPTAVTDGQRVNGWYDLRGATMSSLCSGGVLNTFSVGATDALSATLSAYATISRAYLYNGTTVDRARSITGAVADGTGLGVTAVELAGSLFNNITTATTTTVKSGKGILHKLIFNTYVASATVTIYDNTAASGTKIGTLTLPSTITSDTPICLPYDLQFSTGLTLVTSAATDITVIYR